MFDMCEPTSFADELRALKPGGWFDQAEPDLCFVSDLSNFDDDHPFVQWGQKMTAAGDKVGLKFQIGPYIKGWLKEAGFVNVKEVKVKWSIGGWSNDNHEERIGKWNQARLDMGVKDFCGRRMTNQMGVS